MSHPIECTTGEQEELLERISEALGDDWWEDEGFQKWGWGVDPEAPGHRPMLVIDDDIVFSTFNDGVLSFTTPAPGGAVHMRAFRGHADNGDTLWETRTTPIRDPRLN
jgi:outer membrane protein assembly factor BamB